MQLPGPYCITTCTRFLYSASSAQSTASCYSISTLRFWGDFCNSVFLCLLSLSPTLCSLSYCAWWKLWLEQEDVLGLLMAACCEPPVSCSQAAVIWCGFSLLHGLTHHSTVRENKHWVPALDLSHWWMNILYHFTLHTIVGNEEYHSFPSVKSECQYNICLGKNNIVQSLQLALLKYNWCAEKHILLGKYTVYNACFQASWIIRIRKFLFILTIRKLTQCLVLMSYLYDEHVRKCGFIFFAQHSFDNSAGWNSNHTFISLHQS